jgi:hypothetical protein
MSWDDPEMIAAMEALKDEPAPVPDRLTEKILSELERRAAAQGDLEKITETRVMRALTPVALEMKSAFEASDHEKVARISRGILKGLGFGISAVLPYVPAPYRTTAITMLFKSASEHGVVDLVTEPKK